MVFTQILKPSGSILFWQKKIKKFCIFFHASCDLLQNTAQLCQNSYEEELNVFEKEKRKERWIYEVASR